LAASPLIVIIRHTSYLSQWNIPDALSGSNRNNFFSIDEPIRPDFPKLILVVIACTLTGRSEIKIDECEKKTSSRQKCVSQFCRILRNSGCERPKSSGREAHWAQAPGPHREVGQAPLVVVERTVCTEGRRRHRPWGDCRLRPFVLAGSMNNTKQNTKLRGGLRRNGRSRERVVSPVFYSKRSLVH
jgi:hypothetical protein